MMFDDRLEEEQTIAEERLADSRTHDLLEGTLRSLDSLQPVVSLPGTATVAEAVDAMIENRIGCIVVTRENRLVGMFTERDVVTRIVARGAGPSEVTLEEAMTPTPETLSRDSRLVFALNKMTVGGFRHIPVVDQAGRPEAVVSMRDVVEHVVSFYADVVFNLPASEDTAPSAREGA